MRMRERSAVAAVAAVLLGVGCNGRKAASGPQAPSDAGDLQPLVVARSMTGLKWPDDTDVQPAAQRFYESRNYALAWSKDGKPTTAATGFVTALQALAQKGLNPEDYDAGLLHERLAHLSASDAKGNAAFDAALTVDLMRAAQDLHMGRVNPSHFSFDIKSETKALDLPDFVANKALDATDAPGVLQAVEPTGDPYLATEKALAHYIDLAKQPAAEALPTVARPVAPGGSYSAVPALWKRLQLEGDAPAGDAPAAYNDTLATAVKAFQHRHGLTEDGKLTPATVTSLNVPLSDRVAQLGYALERWRTLPAPFDQPRLLVNLPEFLLRGYDDSHKLAFTMKVVDGKAAGGHDTPVFTQTMKYLIFRPFWNVPTDIAKKEIVPHMNRTPGYLEAKGYETVNNKGELEAATADAVAHARVMVREKPGPKNSLGLVKFMFPNEYDIYMHSTPEVQLFDRTRRDFSHGCVRVQKPDELAAWVLHNQDDWSLEKVQEAMNNGEDNKQVNLKEHLPVVIFYLTAMPAEDGQMHFFDDIYGYDDALKELLNKGMPYPKDPVKVNPKTMPGDTV